MNFEERKQSSDKTPLAIEYFAKSTQNEFKETKLIF